MIAIQLQPKYIHFVDFPKCVLFLFKAQHSNQTRVGLFRLQEFLNLHHSQHQVGLQPSFVRVTSGFTEVIVISK